MADSSSTPAAWTNISGRDLTATKLELETQIRVSYLDGLGTNMLTRGWGCRWRLTVDGAAYGRPFNTYNSNATGWRLDSTHLQWIISGLPAGAHRYRIQVLRPETASVTGCRAGLSGPQNHLLIEEIRPVPAVGDHGVPILARAPSPDVSSNFADSRHSPVDWEDLPGRSFSFEKKADDTTLRLNYEDVLGYDMISENPACAWRLRANGVIHKPFTGHSSQALGFRLWPTSLEWYLEGLEAGVHNFQIQVRKLPGAGQCIAGWIDGEAENFIEVEELDSARIAVTKTMAESATASTAWVDVPGRSIIHQKQYEDTTLKVSYMDNLGYNMKSANVGCFWRLTMDGAAMQREVTNHANTSHDGWRIHPRHLTWFLPNIPIGQHNFKIQVKKASTGVSQCLTGWPNGDVGNSFVIQEFDSDETSIIRNLSAQNTGPNSWTNISARDLVHRKRGADTQVRVSYLDTLGTDMKTRGWGCRWRLTVDGVVKGRPYNSYNSNATGWRMDPTQLQWVVNDLEPGDHRYRIQLLRPDSATNGNCYSAISSAQNFLFIKEVNPEVIDDSLPTEGRDVTSNVSDYAPDSRMSPGVWTDLPGRVFQFNKEQVGSILRVAYSDVLGYDMVAEGPSCSWRLTVDGEPTRSFGGHSSQAHGLRLWPTNMEWFLEGLSEGPKMLRIQVLKGTGASQCLAGWQQGDAENFIEAEELDPYYMEIVHNMAESATASTSWVDIPGRSFAYEKTEHESALKVRYMDNFGYNMKSSGAACSWRLLMDNQVVEKEISSHANTSHDGWRTHPRHLSWFLFDVPMGRHTFKIQIKKASTGVSQCVSGWPNTKVANSFSVQEFNEGEMALVRGMAASNTSPNAWTNIPSRDVTHTKQEAESQVRITYTDGLGTAMLLRGLGCRWQLTVDGVVKGRPYNSYNSNATGWRMDHSRLQWVVSGLSAGAHRYRIQSLRPNNLTTSHCYAGFSAENSLLIEEIGRELPVPEPPLEWPPRVASPGVSDYFDYTVLSPEEWTDLPGREFGFDKISAGSVLRLSYNDVLGYSMNSEAPGCSWRLMVNDVATRSFGSRTSKALGLRLWPTNMEWLLEDLPVGHLDFKIQVKKGAGVSRCFAGWNDENTENFIEVEELDSHYMEIVHNMAESATASTSWVDIPGRALVYEKQEHGSVLGVNYMDNFGYNMASSGAACSWRLLMDNQVVEKEISSHANTSHDGWRTHPRHLSWFIFGVPLGEHTFKVQIKKASAGVSQCVSGWPNTKVANSFSIQEFNEGEMALVRGMAASNTSPNVWTNIPSRDVTHTKQEAESLVRVTYSDGLGTAMLLRGLGCRWQLTVDNEIKGRNYISYNSNATGWRMDHSRLQWIIDDLGAGAHRYRIQALRPDANTSSHCYAGFSPENFLLVEEIGRELPVPEPPLNLPDRAASPEVSNYFAYTALSPGDWMDLPGREFSFNKTSGESVLRLSYNDILGYSMTSEGPACSWRLLVGNTATLAFGGRTSKALGLRLWPTNLEWLLEDLPMGRLDFKIQVKKGAGVSRCFAGWYDGSAENFIEVEELDPHYMEIIHNMAESATASTSWVDIPGRSLIYEKEEPDSALEVNYMDNFGYNMASSGAACSWRLLMDNQVVEKEISSHANTSHDGWRTHPRHLSWFLFNVPLGEHAFKIQIKKASAGVSQCVSGWPNTKVANSLSIREFNENEVVLKRSMAASNTSPNAWTNIPSRDITHSKQEADSQIRVTYTDGLGTAMLLRGLGCRWQLTVDGVIKGRIYNSYNSNATGWRMDHSRLQWVINDLSEGAHRYRIQSLRPDANTSSHCYAGFSAENSLQIEEIGREIPVPEPPLDLPPRAVSDEVSDYFAYTSLSPADWADLPGREFGFEKTSPESVLRVSYNDTLGYSMIAEGPGCSWRLLVNGAATQSFGSRTSKALGLRVWPTNLEWLVEDLPVGHHDFKVQVKKESGASRCFAGWFDNNAENFIEVEELDPYYMAVTKGMGESATASTSWVDIPGRSLVYEKKEDKSGLEINYIDNFGYNMSSSGAACSWRLLMDNRVVEKEISSHANTSHDGWRTHPRHLSWFIYGAALGEHTFKIQIKKSSAGVSQCVSGWPNTKVANRLSIQEFNEDEILLTRSMAASNTSPNAWTNIPSRDISHVKKEANTQVRVTYTDGLGTTMLLRGLGCRWQLTVDNVVKGRPYNSYNSNATGHRMDHSRLQWVVSGLSEGAHRYRIQSLRPDSTTSSHCYAGFSAENSLQIEEIGYEVPVPEPPQDLPSRAASNEVSDYFAYTALSPGEWTDLPGREFSFNKTSAETVLRLNYSDALGYNMTSEGPACSWRLLVDNVATRTFGSRSSKAQGVRLWPTSLEWHLEGLAQGAHQFKIQVLKGTGVSQCYAGWSNGEAENFIEAEELAADRVSIARHMAESATSSTSWVDIPGRTLVHEKQEDPTFLKISYMDNLGYNMSSSNWACNWRLLMDDVVVQKETMNYANTSHDGWRTHPHNLSWIVPDVPQGQHTFKIQVKKASAGVSQCASGWPNATVANALVVQELDSDNIAIRQNLSDVSSTPAAWTNITNRDLSHAKQAAGSQVRVTYVDSVGTEMLLRGQGCQWRLMVDNQPKGRLYSSYNSEATGWRFGYGKMQWVLNDLSAGSHNYKIQFVRLDASRTNHCRAGMGAPQNYLMVEEIGQ